MIGAIPLLVKLLSPESAADAATLSNKMKWNLKSQAAYALREVALMRGHKAKVPNQYTRQSWTGSASHNVAHWLGCAGRSSAALD